MAQNLQKQALKAIVLHTFGRRHVLGYFGRVG